jgi:hypothetical protein
MRSSHVLILVATSLLAICGGAPATEQTTRVASSVVYSNDAIINLSEGKLPVVDADDEERAISLQRVFDLRVFNSSYLALMKRSTAFKLKIFKKWDRFTMEQIKVAIGEAKLSNPRLAKMMVDYVQNHRVYKA